MFSVYIYYNSQSFGKEMFSIMSVCLFFHGEGSMWPLPMMHWTSPLRDTLNTFRNVQTCLIWISLYREPSDTVKFVQYEKHTVGKRAVGILLQCFLVFRYIHTNSERHVLSLSVRRNKPRQQWIKNTAKRWCSVPVVDHAIRLRGYRNLQRDGHTLRRGFRQGHRDRWQPRPPVGRTRRVHRIRDQTVITISVVGSPATRLLNANYESINIC